MYHCLFNKYGCGLVQGFDPYSMIYGIKAPLTFAVYMHHFHTIVHNEPCCHLYK